MTHPTSWSEEFDKEIPEWMFYTGTNLAYQYMGKERKQIMKDFVKKLLSKTLDEQRRELVEEIEKMKRETTLTKEYICTYCHSFDDCDCDGFNEGLDAIISLINKKND